MGANEVVSVHGMPAQVGRYQIVERVGRGAMGSVYRARDAVMERDVAVKLLAADFEDDPEIQTRFLREAQAAARLAHPNIITIFDIGREAGHFFIVMELLRGSTLKVYVQQPEPIPLDRKLDLMIQLCNGLAAAHRESVYHRDVKPGNLFVRTDGTLKILDFGVARLASSNVTASGLLVGTPDYMSPEQALGHDVDGRSDIFAAGGVFYYLLTGRKPFPADDLVAVLHQVQKEDPAPFTDVEAPPPLARIINKALAKDRRLRYQSCEELIADLVDVRRLQLPDPPRAAAVEPSGPATVASDDTVELPVPGAKTDETVEFATRVGWRKRMSSRLQWMMTTVSTLAPRFRGPSAGAR
jgi:serine/threonine protein kinase